MREIKFRAWNTETNEWEHFFYIENDGSYTVIRSGEPYPADDFLIVDQFTGLYDKNGKEIYKGDIYNDCGEIGVIQLSDFTVDDVYDCGETNVFGWNCSGKPFYDCGEVIGNIHENPELLEAAK